VGSGREVHETDPDKGGKAPTKKSRVNSTIAPRRAEVQPYRGIEWLEGRIAKRRKEVADASIKKLLGAVRARSLARLQAVSRFISRSPEQQKLKKARRSLKLALRKAAVSLGVSPQERGISMRIKREVKFRDVTDANIALAQKWGEKELPIEWKNWRWLRKRVLMRGSVATRLEWQKLGDQYKEQIGSLPQSWSCCDLCYRYSLIWQGAELKARCIACLVSDRQAALTIQKKLQSTRSATLSRVDAFLAKLESEKAAGRKHVDKQVSSSVAPWVKEAEEINRRWGKANTRSSASGTADVPTLLLPGVSENASEHTTIGGVPLPAGFCVTLRRPL
jgi:hypothetical protein